ncbi:MAG: response regulator [Deltaproteobacteria bacterium]|nr:response regulator [Deltaproteobacteria bacterium]
MPKSVFVIDDSATMRKVFEMTFAGEDIAVVTHDSADGAVARARELRPNAIIVDVNLPGTSSYDLVKSLRGEPNLSSVPVYLLYSDHSPLDEAAARAAGAQGAVLKPFDSQAMIDRVRQSVSGATATAAAVAPARPAAPPLPPGAPKLPTAAPVAVARPAPAAPMAAPMAPAAPSIRPATPPATPVRPARVTPDDLLPEFNEAPRVSARPEPIAAPTPVIPVQASDLAKSVADQVAAKTASLGLTPQQAEAITALTREVVERVVWEVVPVLAETMIREELKRLTSP